MLPPDFEDNHSSIVIQKGNIKMKKINRIISIILTAAIGFTAAGCAGGNQSSGTGTATKAAAQASEETKNTEENTAEELKTIRIGAPAADASQLVENAGAAKSYGFLEEELAKAGYKAEYIGFGQGGTAVNEALASGQLDAAFVGDIPTIIARGNGLDIVAAASLNSSAEMGLLAGPGKEFKEVADLKGKNIAALFGTVTYVYLVNLLGSEGIGIDEVNIINDLANAATLIATGDADALISTGAGLYQFEGAGLGSIAFSSRNNPDQSSQFYFYGNRSYFEENPEAVKAVIKALIRSKDKASEDPDSLYKALDLPERPAALVEKIYPRENGFEYFEPYLTQSIAAKYESTAKILLDSGIVTTQVKAADFFDTKYLDEVYKELGRAIPS